MHKDVYMFTNSRHDLVFITEVDCVLCEVRHENQHSRASSMIDCKQVLELRDTKFIFPGIDWIYVAKLWRNFILRFAKSI